LRQAWGKARWVAFSLVFFGMIWVYAPRNLAYLGGDSAQYIILAESLAHGNGYHAVNYPGAPFFYHYPPVFPLLLTPIIYFFGRNFFLMHFMVALCGYGALLTFFILFKKFSDDTTAFVAMVFTAVSVPFVMYALRYILSDVVFLFFAAQAFFWFVRYLEKDHALNMEAFLTLIFFNLAYFTRYAGLTVFLSAFLVLVFFATLNKNKKIMLLLAGVAVPVLLWQMICHLFNPGSVGRYMHQFAGDSGPQSLFKVGGNMLYYAMSLGAGIFGYIFDLFGNLAGDIFLLLTAIAAIFGIVAVVRFGRGWLFFIYFLIYFLLIAVWPFGYGYGNTLETMRFSLPLVPFLCFFIAHGLYSLKKNLPSRGYNIFLWSYILMILFAFTFSLRNMEPWHQSLGPNGKDFIRANQWIAQNGKPGAIVLSRKDALSYFYSGHQAIVYPYSRDVDKIWRTIIDNHVRYIVVDSISSETLDFLVPAIMAHKESIKPVYLLSNAAVFEVINYPVVAGKAGDK